MSGGTVDEDDEDDEDDDDENWIYNTDIYLWIALAYISC